MLKRICLHKLIAIIIMTLLLFNGCAKKTSEETTKKENEGKIFISEALRILTQAFDKDPFLFHKEEILTELATTYAKVGQHEIALKIAESIDYGLGTAVSLKEIAMAYLESEKIDKAVETLNQALKIAEKIEFEEDKARSLAEIATVYAKANEKEKALDIINKAFDIVYKTEDEGIKVLTLSEISFAYFESDMKDKALEILSNAYEIAKDEMAKIKDGNPWLLICIANAYIEVEQEDKALDILNQALKIAEKIESYTAYYGAAKAQALTQIAVSYTKAGQDNKALEVIEKIDSDYTECDKAVALYSISNTYIKAKQIDKALNILEKALGIVEKEGRCFIGGDMSLLEKIAISYSKADKKDKALEILSKDLKEEEKVKVNEVLTLIKKAEINIKEDKKEEALNSLNKALDKISNIVETVVEIEYPKTLKAWLLKEIAINYAKVEF